MRSALVLQHVAFEDLGSLAAELTRAGFSISQVDASTADWPRLDGLAPDLLVALGGPIGVYEREAYPFIEAEVALIRRRLDVKLPTLGICLGAQMMAAALGARVYPGPSGKEIGWAPLEAGLDAEAVPGFAHLLAPDLHVLHWHGDTFDLPPGARHLASTPAYRNQAFSIGHHALGLQFHPEVLARDLERWYVGHACELSAARISIPHLRAQTQAHAPRLQRAAQAFWREWIGTTFARAAEPIRIVAAVINDSEGRVLLVRKKNSTIFIQPGGKREPHEDSLQTLKRELLEELGVHADLLTARRLGEFEDEAVNEPGRRVRAEAFVVEIAGTPTPHAEIEELIWVAPGGPLPVQVAPLSAGPIFAALTGRPTFHGGASA